jgi:hypothetical protein
LSSDKLEIKGVEKVALDKKKNWTKKVKKWP